jgi:hypothetical protein
VSAVDSVEIQPQSPPSIDTDEAFSKLLKRAAKGDAAVLPVVRQLFDADSGLGLRLVEIFGNSFASARDSMIRFAAGKDLMSQEGMRRKIDALVGDLAGPNPTPLERILCERIVLCWLEVNELDRRYIDPSDLTFKDAEYRESRRDHAHKRFLSACKTLATVRKLGLPAIQVNVARQQVNVAGSVSEAPGTTHQLPS